VGQAQTGWWDGASDAEAAPFPPARDSVRQATGLIGRQGPCPGESGEFQRLTRALPGLAGVVCRSRLNGGSQIDLTRCRQLSSTSTFLLDADFASLEDPVLRPPRRPF